LSVLFFTQIANDMSQPTITSPPQEGEEAPDFTLFTSDETPWRLSQHRDSPTVLLFFPGAFTSVCTSELTTVSTDYEGFGDAHVVGISTDSPFVLSEFQSVHGIDFPLLSDHDAEVSGLYGTKYDQNFTDMGLDRIAKRSAFVIDREGVVQYAEVLDNAGRHPDFEEIERTLKHLAS
jgi:peroxiredoxin